MLKCVNLIEIRFYAYLYASCFLVLWHIIFETTAQIPEVEYGGMQKSTYCNKICDNWFYLPVKLNIVFVHVYIFSDNYAVRNSTAGGWLLTSLYSQLTQFLEAGKLWTTEFSQILNATLKEMTTKNFKPSETSSPLYGAFSPGCFTHCLTKHVFFTKKS